MLTTFIGVVLHAQTIRHVNKLLASCISQLKLRFIYLKKATLASSGFVYLLRTQLNLAMFSKYFHTFLLMNIFLFFGTTTNASVFVKYIVENGKIEIGTIFDDKNERATFKVLKSEVDSFCTEIANTSLLDLWLSNETEFKLVVLPLLDKDSILIQISSNRISVSYLNAGTQYRLRENVVSDWLNGCSALPMQEGSDPIKVKIAKTKSKWACHYRNIYNARSKSDAFDTATQAFLNLYEAYGLINEEVNLMRALSITGKRDRIGKDNLKSFFSVIGGSPLDDNVMVHNALLGYFHQLEKSGFEGGDYRKALQHIDTLWKSSRAKMRFFQKLMETEWAEGALSEEIADVMNLSLPAKKERVDKKATATNAPIALPKSVAHYQDEVVFSDGNVSSIDSLLTDTTHVLKLVDFWASWCYPCRMAYKNSEVLRKKLQSKGVQIIYVSTDKIETSWINANKQENLEATGISVRLVQPQTANIIQQLMIFAIPRYLLFDKSGKLLNANMPGFKEAGLLPKIEKYLRAAGN